MLHFSKRNCLEITSSKNRVEMFIVKCRVKITLEMFGPYDNLTGKTMAPTYIYHCYGNSTYQNVAKVVDV